MRAPFIAAAGIVPVYVHSPCLLSLLSVKSVAPSIRYITDTLTGVMSLPTCASIASAPPAGAVSMIPCCRPFTVRQSTAAAATGTSSPPEPPAFASSSIFCSSGDL